MAAVQALGFKALRQADVQQHAFRLLGQGDCFLFQLSVFFFLTLEALGKADAVGEVFLDQRQGLVHLIGVHHAAARALIPGRGSEIADDGHLGVLFERQDVSIVLQQHNAFFRRFPGSFVLLLGMLNKGDSTSLLLSGVVAGTISSSCLMCLVTIAGTQEMCSMTWFLLGDLAATDPLLLRFFAVFAPCVAFLLWLLSPKANALALGDDYAWSMGSDPKKTSCALIFLASLLTAGSVALSGIIGFVGLIVPHILRKCGYSDNRKLFPLSFFAGGVFLIFCDLVSRSVFPEREVPSGVITSLLGGALFLWLLHGRNRERRGK